MVEGPLAQLSEHGVALSGSHIDWPLYGEPHQEMQELMWRLKHKREMWAADHPGETFPGVLLIEASTATPVSQIKRVAASAAAAGYSKLSFIGIQLSR